MKMLLLALCLKYSYFFPLSHLSRPQKPWILYFKSQAFLFSSSSSSGKRVCNNELHCLQALSEEKVAYERSTSRNIYLNVAVNTLKKLRSLVPNSPSSTNSTYHTCGLLIGALLGLEATERNLLKRQTHFSEALR